MRGNLEKIVNNLMAKITSLETKVENQTKEITKLSDLVQTLINQLELKEETNELTLQQVTLVEPRQAVIVNPPVSKNRRNFLKKIAGYGAVTLAVGILNSSTSQKEAQARIVVNPSEYPIQFGAIATPPNTTLTGVLGDTSVRIGLAACGDPLMDYSKLPLFDAGVYAQGAAYGVYATTDRRMGVGGYFLNTAPAGISSAYAISGISSNGMGIYGKGGDSYYGVSGVVINGGAGVSGYSSTGYGVQGESTDGRGLRGSSENGVPLSLSRSQTVPSSVNRIIGDFYLDISGRVYVWAKNDANSADIWRQIQFVPA